MVEDRVRELELEIAVLKSTVSSIIVAIDKNTKAQEELAAVFNQAKGIRFLLIGMFIIGTFITDICLRLFWGK